MDNCIFCKIIKGEIPTTKVYEDERVIAIRDIHPQAEFHVLVMPKKHVDEFYNIEDDRDLIAMKNAIQRLIRENDLMGKGYKLQAFGGGAQEVSHLHLHLLSPIKPPG